jgi:hypothetical protein
MCRPASRQGNPLQPIERSECRLFLAAKTSGDFAQELVLFCQRDLSVQADLLEVVAVVHGGGKKNYCG